MSAWSPSFPTVVISNNRITIDKTIAEMLGLKRGTRIEVMIRVIECPVGKNGQAPRPEVTDDGQDDPQGTPQSPIDEEIAKELAILDRRAMRAPERMGEANMTTRTPTLQGGQ